MSGAGRRAMARHGRLTCVKARAPRRVFNVARLNPMEPTHGR